MKENIIYGLRDPRNDVYQYIGKSTVGNSRALSHLRRSHSKMVNDWADGLSKVNLVPLVDIIEKVDDINDLSEREKYWIDYYKSINTDILNSMHASREINNIVTKEDDDIFDYFSKKIDDIHIILRKKRKHLRITAIDAANGIGIARNTLYLFENGSRQVSYGTLLKYISFLKKFIDDEE